MRSRSPLFAAAFIAFLALLIAVWSWRGGGQGGGETRGGDRAGALPQNPVGDTALHQRLPTAARVNSDGLDAGASQTPAAPGQSSQAPPNEVAGGRGQAVSEEDRRLARRDQLLARQAAISAAEEPRLVAADQQPVGEDPGAAIRDQQNQAPIATPQANSIYQTLSNEQLLELLVALNRLRDAGVFQKLSPDQFHDVVQLMGDAEGVKDANVITQNVLGMPVGEWLDKERGPQGTFVLE